MSNDCRQRKLWPVFFAFFLSIVNIDGYAREKLVIDGSTGVKPLVEALVGHYKQTRPSAVVDIGAGLNPQKRIQALIDEEIDIAMASHGVDIQHITQLGLKAHRVAKMAVVIGVNKTVSVTNILDQQLCDIYGGKINNWSLLKGPTLSVVPMLRPFNEVDAEVVRTHITCFSEVKFPTDIKTFNKSGQMAKAIRQTPGAVGMTTLVRVAQSRGKMTALSINGIPPDPNNLLSGAYPFTRDSFLITALKPNKQVAALLAFVRSDEGRAVIIANNAVPAE